MIYLNIKMNIHDNSNYIAKLL